MTFEELRDVFGKDAYGLSHKRLFLIDMDGTIYKEETVFDGALDLLRIVDEMGGRYVFVTNNSSKSAYEYIEKVNRLGIKADIDNIFTSAQATVLYLNKNFPGKKVYCQGTISLVKELIDSGIDITEKVEDDVGLVLVGFDTELTSAKLRNTCELLQKDIPYIATNPDLRCPVRFGFIPDCGSICNMIKAATGKEPVYIGKPEPIMIDIVRERFGYTMDETVMIGDRLYTDIATGLNAGVTTVCVLTGEATKEDIQIGSIKPTFTFESVKKIFKVLAYYKIMKDNRV